MGKENKTTPQSHIQWTGVTWNPWHGCKKVSEGCKFCYMFRDKERYGQNPKTVMRSKTLFDQPLRWSKPQLIFTCSWSDWFIEEADLWRDEAWEIIRNTPQHTYQILTKRPERIMECLPADWGDGYSNVWLGVSVESNKHRMRILQLSDIPASVRFISAEPLIGPLDLSQMKDMLAARFHWIILGGESGNLSGKYRFRPCNAHWLLKIIAHSKSAGLAVFVKQLGTYLKYFYNLKDKQGGNIDEWPFEFRVREFPTDISEFQIKY